MTFFLFFFYSYTLKQSFSTSVRVKAAHELFIVQYIHCTYLSPNVEGDVEVRFVGQPQNEKQVILLLLTFT